MELNDSLNFRPYAHTDQSACIRLFKTNVPKYFTVKEELDYGPWLTRRIDQMETHYYVGIYAGEILACGGFVYKEQLNQIWLAWGFIDRAWHKKGFGKILLRFRLAEIKRLYPGVPLLLDTTQFSFGFFERMGFVTYKITENFYAPGYHRYDMTYLQQVFPPNL